MARCCLEPAARLSCLDWWHSKSDICGHIVASNPSGDFLASIGGTASRIGAGALEHEMAATFPLCVSHLVTGLMEDPGSGLVPVEMFNGDHALA